MISNKLLSLSIICNIAAYGASLENSALLGRVAIRVAGHQLAVIQFDPELRVYTSLLNAPAPGIRNYKLECHENDGCTLYYGETRPEQERYSVPADSSRMALVVLKQRYEDSLGSRLPLGTIAEYHPGEMIGHDSPERAPTPPLARPA